jgi:hypothetical protein
MRTEDFVDRCRGLIAQGDKILATKRPPPKDVIGDNKVDESGFAEWKAAGLSFLAMVFGEKHTHFELFKAEAKYALARPVVNGIGTLRAALADLENGFLGRVQDLVTAGIFVDFLGQSKHLLETGYKDAAASVAGAVLEDGLRRIASINTVPVKNNDDLSALNHKLADAQVYNRLTQKKVQVWNDVRNNAAHGKFEEYKVEDVRQMIDGIETLLGDHL